MTDSLECIPCGVEDGNFLIRALVDVPLRGRFDNARSGGNGGGAVRDC